MDAQDYPIRHFADMQALATVLKELPAQIVEHRYWGESFGSWVTTLQYKGHRLRLVFDGRDSAWTLEAPSAAPDVWTTVWSHTDTTSPPSPADIAAALKRAAANPAHH